MSDHERHFNPVPRRILVPIDGDPPAEGAFAQAASIAEALDAELVLLGVDSPPLVEAFAVAAALPATEAVDELTRERVRKARDRLPEGVRSRAIFGSTPEGSAIVDAVDAEAVDLVVVAMRRGGELSHLLRDGEDRYVLHHCPVPVLVVPEA
jgi:nucleotide-binding universal stress UspA family protein